MPKKKNDDRNWIHINFLCFQILAKFPVVQHVLFGSLLPITPAPSLVGSQALGRPIPPPRSSSNR